MRIFNWVSKHLIPRFFDKIRVGNNEDGGCTSARKLAGKSKYGMITSFLEWVRRRETVLLEKTQDEAEEFLGQDGSVMDYNFL